MSLSHKGGDMVRLLLVGVPECLRNPVVECLDILLALLLQVLERDAERLCGEPWSVGLQELLLDLGPVVDVEVDDIFQRGRPFQSLVPQGQEELVALGVIVRPVGNPGSSVDPFEELLRRDGILFLDAVK